MGIWTGSHGCLHAIYAASAGGAASPPGIYAPAHTHTYSGAGNGNRDPDALPDPFTLQHANRHQYW